MQTVLTLKQFLSMEISPDMRSHFQSIKPDDDLIALGLIDSMMLLKLVSFIEETFGVRIFDEDVTKENFSSFNSIEHLIERKQKS